MSFIKIVQLMNILMSLFYTKKDKILKKGSRNKNFEKNQKLIVLKDLLALVVIYFK